MEDWKLDQINEIKRYQGIIALLVYINMRKTLKGLFLPLKMLVDYRLNKKVTFLPVEVYLLQFLLNVKRKMR